MTKAVTGFIEGLTCPSRVALATTLATLVVISSGVAIFVGPGILSPPKHLSFAKSEWDDHLFTFGRAQGLSESEPAVPKLIAIGGSGLRASVLARILRDELYASTGNRFEIYELASSGQTMWESIALADYIPEGTTGTLVISVGPMRLAKSIELLPQILKQDRLGPTGSLFDRELTLAGLEPRPKSGFFLWDNRHFLLSRRHAYRLNRFLGRQPIPGEHRYFGMKETIPVTEWRKPAKELAALTPKRLVTNLAVLARLLESVRSNTSLRILLLEQPINPKFLEHYNLHREYQKYKQQIVSFADEESVRYVDLNRRAELVSQDFLDPIHLLNRQAVRNYSMAVANEVAADNE